MGKDRPGPGAEVRLRALTAAAGSGPPLEPPAGERLYGRQRGHALRPRQKRLLEATLPRLRLDPARAAAPDFEQPELWLEIGFGGGEHSLAQIAANPQAMLLACEVFENGICSLLGHLVPDGEESDGALPPNLHVWDSDARRLLRLLPEACLDRVFLMFPDPWPKARHARRRFVHPVNLKLLARTMREGAAWHVASDDPTYQAWVARVMAEQTDFATAEPSCTRPPGWPGTRYEAKALRAGRQPLYWVFHRNRCRLSRAATAPTEVTT